MNVKDIKAEINERLEVMTSGGSLLKILDVVNSLMTDEDKEWLNYKQARRREARRRKLRRTRINPDDLELYEGFGEIRSYGEWAHLLNMDIYQFKKKLDTGLSVEEIYRVYGRTLPRYMEEKLKE